MSMKTTTGLFKVWHIPQVPGKAFEVVVDSLYEAIRLQTVLADYDYFQFAQNIKPDYSNASGIMTREDGEWTEYHFEEDESV